MGLGVGKNNVTSPVNSPSENTEIGRSKAPAFQFYAQSWLSDRELRKCSIEARGLWIDMLAIMHQSKIYGHLYDGLDIVSNKNLAQDCRIPVKKLVKLIQELEVHNIFSRDINGVPFSRKMVRDEKRRNSWRERQAKHRGKSAENE